MSKEITIGDDAEKLKLFVGYEVKEATTIAEIEPLVRAYVVETQEPAKVQKKIEELIEKWREAIEGKNTAILKQNEKIMGMVRLKTIKPKGTDGEESVYEIENLYIDPHLRRHRLSPELLEQLLKNLEKAEPNATIIICTQNKLVIGMCEKLLQAASPEDGTKKIGLEGYLKNYSTEKFTPDTIQREIAEGWTAYKFRLSGTEL